MTTGSSKSTRWLNRAIVPEFTFGNAKLCMKAEVNHGGFRDITLVFRAQLQMQHYTWTWAV